MEVVPRQKHESAQQPALPSVPIKTLSGTQGGRRGTNSPVVATMPLRAMIPKSQPMDVEPSHHCLKEHSKGDFLQTRSMNIQMTMEITKLDHESIKSAVI